MRHLAHPRRIRQKRLFLGPVRVAGHTVALRSPRLDDATAWREIRLRDRRLIEPYWLTARDDWDRRHTVTVWVGECLARRRAERSGTALPLVVEIDGRFAGQCNFECIDPAALTAQTSVWIDSRFARAGIGLAVGGLAMSHLFDTLGLRRISAAICTDNVAAARTVQLLGCRREGTMSSYLDVGGLRRDHDLWAITSEMWQQQQLRAQLEQVAASDTPPVAGMQETGTHEAETAHLRRPG
ncbi:GNAT family N-acetyltransferase [Rhodococcus indonesiensis]|uniref:GNAT family N-acetyltransferase n=1 Tax=Rhodococcus indonesiensis TaxID=3055869 RepID=UPI0039F6D076